jgi:hypothetical protein
MLYKLDGFEFIAPSKRKNKKYDVYKNGQYLASFGDIRYQQFFDRIGAYDYLNHYDQKRRNNYIKRHHKDIYNFNKPGYFSFYYLW